MKRVKLEARGVWGAAGLASALGCASLAWAQASPEGAAPVAAAAPEPAASAPHAVSPYVLAAIRHAQAASAAAPGSAPVHLHRPHLPMAKGG